GFDGFVEAQCAMFYAETMGRPSLPPGIYFLLLLIGYFEGIDSERGIAWRAADSFALRDFLAVGLEGAAAGPLDDFAHASVDRPRNASRRLHLGTAVLEYGRLDQGQDHRHRRDDTGSQRCVAQHRPARQPRELRGVSDDARQSLGHRDADARRLGADRSETEKEGLE